jgi:probable phosphoglycerate mutase
LKWNGAVVSDFYLIRHGEHDWLKKGIAGRIPGVHLNDRGREQARQLVNRLEETKFDAIYSSPLERAVQTAEPLARARQMDISLAPEIIELDFGEWSGALFEKLRADPRWAAWNQHRSVVRMPGGELMTEVQNRIVVFMERLHREKSGGTFALFGHGDVIRAAICHWLGAPLDLLPRLDIEPASVSVLRLDDSGPHVMTLNKVA